MEGVNSGYSPGATDHGMTTLREQWAGLFQRFLSEQVLLKEVRVIEDMQSTVQTLDRLVTFLTEAREKGDESIQSILLISHPAFGQLKKMLAIPYRVLFTNLVELYAWLEARGFAQVDDFERDDFDVYEWVQTIGDGTRRRLKLNSTIFDDDGKLKVFTAEEWDEDWITVQVEKPQPTPADSDFGPAADDDDVPFWTMAAKACYTDSLTPQHSSAGALSWCV
jgi:hypothetical protein